MKKTLRHSSRAWAMLLMMMAVCLPQKMFAYDQPTLGSDGYYQIATASNLAWFRDYVNASTANAGANACLTADIDLSTVCSSSLGNWTPIAASSASYSSSTLYTGTFDGKGKTISGLYINASSSDHQALFDYNGGIIENLTVDATVIGKSYCAAIAAYNKKSISYCTSKGSITASSVYGGISGTNQEGGCKIEHCVNYATIARNENNTDDGSGVGGIVGANHGAVAYCANKGKVCNGNCVGGIAGVFLAQVNKGNIVSNCSNVSSVTGYGKVGGIIGSYASCDSLINCYNAGDVTSTATSNAGAIVGEEVLLGNYNYLLNCYYLNSITLKKNNVATIPTGVGNQTTSNASGYSLEQFKSGAVTRLLNGSGTENAWGGWGQTLGKDDYPVFMEADNSNRVCCTEMVQLGDDSKILVKRYGNPGTSFSVIPFFKDSLIYYCVEYKIIYEGNKHSTGIYPPFQNAASYNDEIIYAVSIDMSKFTQKDAAGNTYYEIENSDKYKWLSYYVNSSSKRAATNAILTNNINMGSEQVMIGCDSIPYAGIFDGNGKTLTVNLTGSSQMMAPFPYVSGATVRNVKVAGSVTSSDSYASGLVGSASGTSATISNCEVAAAISSPYCGGFIGNAGTGTPIISNSIFSGSLTATKYSGCFIGWGENSSTISNSLSVPASISGGTSYDFVCTQDGGSSSLTNSYSCCSCTNKQGIATDETTMKGGKIARLLNGGDGATENVLSVWGQTIGTDTHPVFMTANNANAVYCVTAGTTEVFGNQNTNVLLPLNLNFSGTTFTRSIYSDGTNTYTDSYPLAAADVKLTATDKTTDMAALTQKGSDGKTYYQIANVEEFDWLSYYVNSSSANASTNAILMNDLDLGTDQTMIGTSSIPYSGTFDGNGNTLTVNYSGSSQMMAPFTYISGATVRNVKVAGSVTSSDSYASGLVGSASGTSATISNCEVAAAISSPYCGGFIGNAGTGTPIISNSIFSGSLTATKYSGCFIGWGENSSTISNSLSVPASISGGTSYDFVCTQDGGSSSLTNSYSCCSCTNKQGIATDETTMKGGKIARLLNGDDGATENVLSVWGQTIGTDAHPVFMTANNANAVYCVTAGTAEVFGNQNTNVLLPLNLNFSGTTFTRSIYSDGTNTYTDSYPLAAADVKLTATDKTTDMAALTQKGSDGKTYYQIANVEEFDWLSYYVNSASTNASTNAILTNDIDLDTDQTMIGTSSIPYAGIFDGNGKTLTVNYTNNASECTAPFRYVNGTTVKNLKVSGTIATSQKYAGSLIGLTQGSTNISNCQGDVTINSTVSGDGTHGGLVGDLSSGTTTINNCLFKGAINGSSTSCCSGFVGWNNGKLSISNSLNACTYSVSSTNGATFARNGATCTNCYYVNRNGTAQGTQKTAAEIAATATMASLLQGTQADGEYWIADPTQSAYPVLKCFAKAAQFTMNSYKTATYYNSLAWTIPSGLTVYTISALKSGTAHATAYTGTVVPAGTAVLITGDEKDYQLDFDRTSTAAAVSDNMLRGSDLAATTVGDDTSKSYLFYQFSLNAANEENSLGFYYHNEDGSAFTNGAHKAYLPVESASGAAGYVLSFGETTAIPSVTVTTDTDAWYTLNGMKLSSKPTMSGLYINNGRKVYVK
jgi:hypothetical protein